MSIFHKLRDVYFDAVKLGEELAQIPAQCDCGDSAAHLSGSCCCAGEHLDRSGANAEGRGCLGRLEKLSKGIEWFEEDLRREQSQLAAIDADGAAARKLFTIETFILGLSSTLGRLRIDLVSFRETCAHDTLARIKETGVELEKHIAALNSVL